MNPEQLEEQLAECHAALCRLSILALRQSSDITDKEFFDATKHIVTFRNLPEPLQARIRVIREKRWGIV